MKKRNFEMISALDFIYKDTPAYMERSEFINEGSHLFNSKLSFIIGNELLFVPSSVDSSLHCFEGGVFNKNNEPVLNAFQREGISKIDVLLKKEMNISTIIDEPLVYLGQIRNHWGSFLVDSISRLWFSIDNPGAYKYLFMITQPELGLKMHKNIMRFLELFGIKESQVIFINEPTIVSKIIIPDLSYIPNVGYWKEYIDTINQVVSNVENDNEFYDKVYFSRKNFSFNSKTDFGEQSLIKLVEKNGYKVFYPEELTLDKQIIIMNKCNEFCSVGGSLAHNIVFSCIHKPKVVIFNRLADYQWHQWMINEMANVDYIMIDAFVEPYKAVAATTLNGPFLYCVNRFIKKYISFKKWKRGNVFFIRRFFIFLKYSFQFFKMTFHLKKQKN